MANPVWSATESNAVGDSALGGTQALPSGSAAGDHLRIHIAFEKGTDIVITDNGWTLPANCRANQSTNIGLYVAWRTVSAGDVSAGVIDRPSFDESAKWNVSIARITGQHSSTPHNAAGTPASSASGNPDPPSVTSTVDECLLVAVCGTKSAATSFTPPSGYTEEVDVSNTPSLSVARKNQVSAGADNPATFTPSSASEWCAITYAIAPVPSGQVNPPRAMQQYRRRRT